jgi:hypothetical protein
MGGINLQIEGPGRPHAHRPRTVTHAHMVLAAVYAVSLAAAGQC